MILFVVLAFLGFFVTATAGTTVGVDCSMKHGIDCDLEDPCDIKLSTTFAPEFFVWELLAMTYDQEANASEPSCSDSGCEPYTSNTAYYEITTLDLQEPDHAKIHGRGRAAICEEQCSMEHYGSFSGYCQTAGQCTNSTDRCWYGDLMVGSATLEKISKDIVIECDLDDEENCGTIIKPCNAKFHTSSGFSQNDVVSMVYRQLQADGEASCVAQCQTLNAMEADISCCERHESDFNYYTVVDTTTAAEGQVIMGPKGLAAVCPGACAVNAGDPFSGYCQNVQYCAELAGQCAGSTNPVGKAYFQLEPPPPPITGTVNGTISFECGMWDADDCGNLKNPCNIKTHWMGEYEFFRGEIVAMTYHQEANASEPSCSDSGCEEFTSSTFYKIEIFDVDTEDHFHMSTKGRSAFCEEECSMEQDGSFSGYCQTAGQCIHSTDTCEEDKVMPGLATLQHFSRDVVIDCDLDDEENCGTADNPCNAILHASSGFSQDDLVTMYYNQLEENDEESICSNLRCDEYKSNLTYYTVVLDTTTAVEGQVIMGGKAFDPLCIEACGDGDSFSGFCQIAAECKAIIEPCAGANHQNPVGFGYIFLATAIPPTTTTTPPTGTTTPPTGTATGTTEPTTASAMTAAFGLAPAAFAVVAVLALWA